ncbi:MAG: rane protein, partial [Gammaproteobacteria bacterium]|nr:rane protein [Gammaproteobacteria bacterium]
EYLMSLLAWHTGFPAFLVFALIQAALTLWLYTIILDVQADWLYRREQLILEVVTTRPD